MRHQHDCWSLTQTNEVSYESIEVDVTFGVYRTERHVKWDTVTIQQWPSWFMNKYIHTMIGHDCTASITSIVPFATESRIRCCIDVHQSPQELYLSCNTRLEALILSSKLYGQPVKSHTFSPFMTLERPQAATTNCTSGQCRVSMIPSSIANTNHLRVGL